MQYSQINHTVAIIVTYNRLNYLKENLEALKNQTQPLDILVINNASTDGTKDYLSNLSWENFYYENLDSNLGGAGGFSHGIKKAVEMGYTYGWIMDDDAIPMPNAHHELQKAVATNIEFSFLASTVYWTDGRLFPMNRPRTELISDTHIPMLRQVKSVPVQTCSFVGCFFPLENARKVGLPISEFFIYGDDVEYTGRLRKISPAYWIIDSEIIHKAPSITGAEIATADISRINRFYYQARNGIYTAKKNGNIAVFKYMKRILGRIIQIIRFSEDNKTKRILTILRGCFAGLSFNPQIKFPNA